MLFDFPFSLIIQHTQPMLVKWSLIVWLLHRVSAAYHCRLSHLKWFSTAWIWVLHFLHNRLLVHDGELLSLVDELLFKLLLCLGLQELLPEGNVWEHGGKCSGEFNGRLGAFLKRRMKKAKMHSSGNRVLVSHILLISTLWIMTEQYLIFINTTFSLLLLFWISSYSDTA